jgi:plasmid segregation protein ParM
MGIENAFKQVDGVDGGNIKVKTSYLNEKGNIESFDLPTVMAPADAKGDPFKDQLNPNDMSDLDRLHVLIFSKALSSNYYYFGDFARDKANMIQPEGEEKHNNELHIGTALVSKALVAAKLGKDEVIAPYSGGLPIEEHKNIDTKKMVENLIGSHTVEFLDGKFKGKKVTIHIPGGEVRVEGITCTLALKYTIKDNELIKIPDSAMDSDEYVIGDLGAGTLDLALYDHNGLNGTASTNLPIGTNDYIDQMIVDITNHPKFKIIHDFEIEDNKVPVLFRNRDEFMNEIIKPAMKLSISNNKQPIFTASWAMVSNVDVTDIVLKHIKTYCDTVESALKKFWYTKAQKIKNFHVVGGGVAFGYAIFKESLKEFKLPKVEDISDSAYITSISYLIANFVDQQE